MINRNISLDLIRTLAIMLMVIFHFIYDLNYFKWINWNISNNDLGRQFRYIIISLFFICIGASLVYSHAQKFQLKKFTLRLLKVAVGASLITLMSLVMFPHSWIYFGVLHFIFIATLLSIPFINFPRIALITGALVILAELFNLSSKRWPFNYINHLLPDYTTDYVPLFPWVGVILLGIALAHSQWFNTPFFTNLTLDKSNFTQSKSNSITQSELKKARLINLLTLPGKHSLLIYLVHQPLLFAILAPIHWLLN
jgi:uncharacterized membrane protein